MNDQEREELTERFRETLAALPPRPKRKYTKRPSGEVLTEMNRRHDSSANAWVRLALRYGEGFGEFS